MTPIYRGAVGINIVCDTGLGDITGYTKARIKMVKPSGETSLIVPDSVTEATGLINYNTLDGDFDETGEYKFSSYLEFGSNEKFDGEIVKVRVYEPLF